MMPPGTEEEWDECAILFTLRMLGKKWMIFILAELLTFGELYFSEIQRHIKGKYGQKISARVLSDSLNQLEEKGLVTRHVESDKKPVRVRYRITPKGNDLLVVFGALKGWGAKWGDLAQKKCFAFTCIHNAVPILDLEKAWSLLYRNEATTSATSPTASVNENLAEGE